MLDPEIAGTYDAILTKELADLIEGLPAERVIKKALEGEVAPDHRGRLAVAGQRGSPSDVLGRRPLKRQILGRRSARPVSSEAGPRLRQRRVRTQEQAK
mgnify:CR=1 FL=1